MTGSGFVATPAAAASKNGGGIAIPKMPEAGTGAGTGPSPTMPGSSFVATPVAAAAKNGGRIAFPAIPASGAGAGSAGGPSGDRATRTGVTRLLIIRHGETLWNKEGRMQGHLDIGLNDVGKEQAKEVAKALIRLGMAEQIDAVVSSDLSRASETADLIVQDACPCALRVIDEGLREMNFGSLTGQKSHDPDVKAAKQAVLKAWKNGDFFESFPDGESGESLVTRGMRSLRSAANLGSCVVVVAHGGLIRWNAAAMCFPNNGGLDGPLPTPEEAKVIMAKPEVRELVELPVRNCCCSTILFDHSAGTFQPVSWYRALHGDESAKDDTG